MRIEIYSGQGDEYYIRLPGSAGALRWQRQEDCWTSQRGALPDDAQRLEFGRLPQDLQEEVLAFVTRAEAMGNQIWSAMN